MKKAQEETMTSEKAPQETKRGNHDQTKSMTETKNNKN